MTMFIWLTLIACAPKIDPGFSAVEDAKAPVRVVEMHDATSPNVYLQALIQAGSANDPSGQEGLAHLTAMSLTEGGAGFRSGKQVADALYPTGSSFFEGVDREWVTVRLTCHQDHVALCIALFTDVLTQPRFEAADVARVRDAAIYQVTEAVLGDEEALGMEVFDNRLFEGHPYGHPIAGRSGVLPLLNAPKAADFHRAFYVRESVVAGIAGAYSAQDLAAFKGGLAALPTTRKTELVLQSPIPVEGRSLLVVDTETPVTGFHFGHPLAVQRDHKDWAALTVAMAAFGAHRQSHGRLFRTLRTARGLNYGDYSYAEPFVQRGWTSNPEQGVLRSQPYFYIWVRPTGTENGPFALKLALDELEVLVADGLTEQEFQDTKRNLNLGLPMTARDPGRRLAYALDAASTGMPNPLIRLPEALETMTLEQVNEALVQWIRPNDLRIVAVTGEAESLKQQLIEETPTPIVYADIVPSEEQGKRDTTVSEKGLGIPENQVHVVSAEGIFR